MDKLCLTDTRYTNTALIKTQGTKHPEFPGPMERTGVLQQK